MARIRSSLYVSQSLQFARYERVTTSFLHVMVAYFEDSRACVAVTTVGNFLSWIIPIHLAQLFSGEPAPPVPC